MNLKKITLVLLAAIVLGGCVAQWETVTVQNKQISQSGMSVELPEGWVGLAFNKKLQYVSKDGIGLNALVVETIPLADMRKALKVKIDDSMDMLEASKKYMAYWSKNNNITDFDIITEDYIELDGQGHFYIEWTYKDANGTTMRNISQGTVRSGNIVNIAFSAPNIHYFEKNLPAVKSMMGSVKYS